MIDFTIPADLAAERDRVRRFVIDKIVPFERDPRLTSHGPTDELRQELVELARAEKLLTVQAPEELGGRGLTHIEQAVIYEAADGDQPGIVIERTMNTMDRNYVGGHGVVRFENLVLPRESLLGDTGQALRYAQLRLAPARLTHCMRWLGAAERAQSIAVDYAKTRTAFGKPIGEHEGVSFMLADNEIALHQCRLTIWHACWLMDQGEKARHESSIAKSFVSEELFKVADRCVQVLGGIGISDETVVEMIFRDMRAFRLYDGPTEVHKYAIGRRVLR
ncbi:acyl-CoA dehydrogenase family protein [Nocardia sp. NBC_01377]|uniref:acyl-CoA dehydrogenase family protein n=1 Tax=Nocardia sp. NBC_01377 TaxID=2903595 RepID=UPI0032451B2D